MMIDDAEDCVPGTAFPSLQRPCPPPPCQKGDDGQWLGESTLLSGTGTLPGRWLVVELGEQLQW